MADSFLERDTERQVIQFLDAIDGEAESSRREAAKNWEENIRQVRGDQWRLRRAPYFSANIIKNELKKKVATLTEVKPQIHVRATRPNLDKASHILYNACKAIFDKNSTEDAIYRVGQFGMTVGAAFLGIFYNKLENDIEVCFIDPRRVYIDPSVTAAADLDKAQYVRIDSVIPLHEIRRLYPGRGALVKPSERASTYVAGKGRPSVIASVLSMLPRTYKPGQPQKSGPIPRAEIKEYWIKDYQDNIEGSLLFPGGRHIVRAGDIILVDEANPYIDGGWPLEMLEWDTDFDSPWGMDEVQDLRRIQEAINRMGDAWVHNFLLGSNFKIIADLDALDSDQWEKLDNDAGLIIRTKPNRRMEFQPPIEPSPTTPTNLEALIRLCSLLTGNIDMQGRSQATGSAALEGLQGARHTLVRSVARRLETMLERVGQKIISRIFQHYTSDKVLFQQGPSREWISYTYERQKLLEDDNGDPRPAEEISKMYRDYRFMITPGSSLAMTRIQRTMALLQLRSATGFAPSVRRIIQESDIGDPDVVMKEGIEELGKIPSPPPAKGRSGK